MADNSTSHEEHNEQEEQTQEDGAEEIRDTRPLIEYFVKAGVDDQKMGGCALCHQYFMALYLLRERGLIHLLVTTFKPSNPPEDVLKICSGKKYPLVRVHHGLDSNDLDITEVCCETCDDIEDLLERFSCDDLVSRKYSAEENRAEAVFENLFIKFKAFLSSKSPDSSKLTNELRKLDSYFKQTGNKFMCGDRLTRADCYLLPRLQHIRVAGDAYKDFKIPSEFKHLWKYIGEVSSQPAFEKSCPDDRDIISMYEDNRKACCAPKMKTTLMTEVRSLGISQEAEAEMGQDHGDEEMEGDMGNHHQDEQMEAKMGNNHHDESH